MSSSSPRIERSRGYSEQGAEAVASVEEHTRMVSLPRPPRSEQRRASQIYLTDPLLDDSSAAPPLLPPLSTTQPLRAQSPAIGAATAIRRSAAQRDVSLRRSSDEGGASSPYSSDIGARPLTPRGSAASAAVDNRSSPDPSRPEQVRTPNGSPSEPTEVTPRRSSPRTPRQRTSPSPISSLHSPPILLSRAAQTLRYHSPSQSTSSSRPLTPSAEQRAAARRQRRDAAAGSDSDYSVSGESSDSQGWTGIEHSISASPPKSPFLSQILAEARQHQQHQTFTSVVQPMPDDIEDIDSVEHVPRRGSFGSLRSASIEGLSSDGEGRPMRWDSSTISRSMSGSSQHVATEEKAPEMAWWAAAEPVEKLEDPQPTTRARTPLTGAFNSTVSGSPSNLGPTSPSQVGKALEWDEHSAARPTTPQPSSYQPQRPSLSPVVASAESPSSVAPPAEPSPLRPTREPFRRSPTPILTSSTAASTSPTSPLRAAPASPTPRRPSPVPLVTPPKSLASLSRTASISSQNANGRLSPHRTASASAADAPGSSPAASPGSSDLDIVPPGPAAEPVASKTVAPPQQPRPPSTPTQPTRSPLASVPAGESTSVASPSPRRARKDLPPPPEKSRKRASTIRRTSRLPDEERPTNLSPPTEATETSSPLPPVSSSSSTSDFILDQKHGTITTPATPLSASDFAEAYGGKDFGRSPSIEAESASLRSSSHIRSPATGDGLAPSPVLESPPAREATYSIYDPYFSSRHSRADSLGAMADLNAQLSDAISLAGNEPESESTVSTRRPSKADALDLDKRLSEAPSEDSFHEAVASPRMFSTALVPPPLGSPTLPPLPVDASPTKSRSASPVPGNKLDAKAKAAAFIADLKRARAAAGTAAAPVVDASSPSTASAPTSPPTFASPALSLPASSPLRSQDSPSPQREAFHTPSQASTFASPVVAPSPPPLPPIPPMPPAPPTTAILPPLPPPPPPPLPPLPSQPPAIPPRTALNYERRPSIPGDSPALPALPTTSSVSSPRIDHLQRRRPLPPCLSIAPDLKRTRTPGERAIVYAIKINQLRREASGVTDWVLAVRPQTATPGFSGYAPVSPSKSRRDASSASFPSRGDGYKAREIPNGTFSPRELSSPPVPFPGVLNLSNNASRTSLSSGSKPPSALNNHKSSFFGGLGRKASRRSSASGSIGPISGPTLTSQRPSLTGPLNISSTSLASISPSSGGGVGRPLGPRMPSMTRASMDNSMYSSSINPTSPSLTQVPSRSSFSFGSTSGSSLAQMASPSYRGGVTMDDEKIVHLENVLPQASKEALAAALRDAHGDEVLAVSIYLDQAARRP